MANILKTRIVTTTGTPNPNLFKATSMTKDERAVSGFAKNDSTDWTKPFRYYNGTVSNHTFSGDTDIILLNSASNLGIAFQRKATDINLDSTAYYTLSCEAKCTKANASLCIGLSYYNTSDAWVWRGGTNGKAFDALDTWQTFTLKFKPDANTQYIMYCFTVVGVANGTDTLSIRHCKLEKGEVPTQWVANEDDVMFVRAPGFLEVEDICKIQKKGYIQALEFIET